MNPTLSTLPEDIYRLLGRGESFSPDPTNLKGMTDALALHVSKAMESTSKPKELGKLWFSDLGEKCNRKLYYKWNPPTSLVETIKGHTYFKFLYGNIIEEQLLLLAREAGHLVEREQERVEYKHTNDWVLSGRIDAVIDGVLVDVKSTSSFGYAKYASEGVTEANDSFGYRAQLSGYAQFITDIQQPNPSFVFVDKQNGHIAVVPIDPIPKADIVKDIERVGVITELGSSTLATRGYSPKPDGKSGNMKLGTECSYCPYKRDCWPGLKGYAYSSGPVFLTEVKRTPNVPELF